MKKITYFSLLVLGLSLTFACKDKPAETASTETHTAKAPNKDQFKAEGGYTSVKFPLDSAAVDVHRYDSICQKLLGSVPVKGFTIRSRDLLEALGLPVEDTSICEYKHARVYLGMDRTNQFKLFIVPVVGANLSKDEGGEDVPLKDPDAGDQLSVLDLNTPCPKVCATNNIFGLKK
ncbi:MAG: hypothetical protein JST26_17805 [Bacteroidetes bacterium]|nr:hypothetical protein [Bacteroidota bacterium]